MKEIIETLIKEKKYFEIRKQLNELNTVEISEVINEFEISELAKAVGFNVISKDRNPAWKPINDKFANDILEELKIYKPNARITAVHAGLECGVLLEKKAGLSACSIGPNIYSPHSTREHCEVASALFIEKVVRGIVKKYNS